jgi:hypothetical protein
MAYVRRTVRALGDILQAPRSLWLYARALDTWREDGMTPPRGRRRDR